MDRFERAVHQEQVESGLVAAERRHIRRLDYLESEYGFDLDIATDIYGIDLLRYDQPDIQDTLHFWESLNYELNADRRYHSLLFHRVVAVPDARGFSSTPPKQLEAQTVIFSDRPELIMDRDQTGLAFIALRSREPAFGAPDGYLSLIHQADPDLPSDSGLLASHQAEVISANDPSTLTAKLIERLDTAGRACDGEGIFGPVYAIRDWLVDQSPPTRR